jgi:hypothetical protein
MRHALSVLLVICAFCFVGCKGKKPVRTGPPKTDVEFARDVFQRMSQGDISAGELIDFDHLSIAGIDISGQYRNLTTDSSRENFRSSFIKGYSNSFKSSGGNIDALTNWREQSKDAGKTVVAADSPKKKMILITVTRIDGEQYVSAIDLG